MSGFSISLFVTSKPSVRRYLMKNTTIDSLVSATPFTKRFNLCMISDSDSRADSYELVRLSSTTVSTWCVRENISTGWTLAMANPRSFRYARSRAKVAGLHDT